jgi:hypothetical protein
MIAFISIFIISSIVSLGPKNSATDTDLTTFLREDATSDHAYIVNQYQCIQFAMDLTHNASIAGFHFKYAIISPNTAFPEGHIIVAIINNTGAWRFIEPQNDRDITQDILSNGVEDTITIVDTTDVSVTAMRKVRINNSGIIQVLHV